MQSIKQLVLSDFRNLPFPHLVHCVDDVHKLQSFIAVLHKTHFLLVELVESGYVPKKLFISNY